MSANRSDDRSYSPKMDAMSLRALVASNTPTGGNDLPQTYKDVDNIRSRAGLGQIGTENVSPAPAGAREEVEDQFPTSPTEQEPTGQDGFLPTEQAAEPETLTNEDRQSLVNKIREDQGRRELEKVNAEKRTAVGQIEATAKAIPKSIVNMAAGAVRGVDELTLPADQVQDGSLYQMGDDIEEFGDETFHIPSEYEGTVATDIGMGLGSLAGFIATGGVGGSVGKGVLKGAVGNVNKLDKINDKQKAIKKGLALDGGQEAGQTVAAALTAGTLGADEAYQRALDFGVEDDEQLQALAKRGVLPGLIQIANINKLLQPFTKGQRNESVMSAFDRLKRDAGSEAGLEFVGALGQNELAQTYDPETGLFDGSLYAAAMGATSAGLVQGARMGLSKTKEKLTTKSREQENEELATDDVITKKVQEGDYESLATDENLPADRVAVALYADTQREDATPEQKQTSGDALVKMASKLDEEVEVAEQAAKGLDSESRKDMKETLRRLKAFREQKEKAGDTETVKMLDEQQETIRQTLKEAKELPKEEQKVRVDKLDSLRKAQSVATQNRSRMTADTTKDSASGDAVTKARDTSLSEAERVQAGKDTVKLLMSNNNAVSPKQARELADDANAMLSNEDRSYLRALSDGVVARNAASTLDTVSRDVFDKKARDGFKSLPEYQDSVGNALQAGNIASAEKQLENLRAWNKSHKTKAALAQQAADTAAPGKQQAIWNDTTTEEGWSLHPYEGKKMDSQLRKNGGLSFSTADKSKQLASAVSTESKAIDATEKELAAAIKAARQESPAQPTTATTEADTRADSATESESAEASTQEADTSVETAPETKEPEAETATEAEPAEQGTTAEPAQDTESRDGDTTRADITDTSERADTDVGHTEPATIEPGETEQADTKETETATEAKPETVYGVTFVPVKGHMTSAEFYGANLISNYFSVGKSGTDGQTSRPLSTQEDFLTTVLMPVTMDGSASTGLSEYTNDLAEQDSDTGVSQRGLLRAFAGFAKKFNAAVSSNAKPKSKNFRHEDMLNFFRDENGQIPENVLTALSFSGYTWVMENGGMPLLKTKDGVKTMLGLNSNDFLEQEHYNDLKDMGELRSNVIQDLGRKAVGALGLRINPDAPQNHKAQLETQLGSHVLASMENAGLVTMTGKETSAFSKAEEGAIHYFIRPTVNDESVNGFPTVDQIMESSTNTSGVLNSLFDVESRTVWPSFEPITEMSQRKAQRTGEDIPKEQRDIVAGEMENKPWTPRADMKNVLDRLQAIAPETFMDLLSRIGGATNKDSYISQATNEAGNQGKREAIQRELEHVFEFFGMSQFKNDDGSFNPNNKIFFPLSVWSNQRVGIASNTINPLTSKIHRELFGMQEWEHTVPLTRDSATEDGQYRLDQFKLAAMEGLGYPVDKQSNETSLKTWEAEVMDGAGNILDPELQKMTNIAMELTQDTGQQPSAQDLNDFAEFNAKNEGFHTLSTLSHLAQFQLAKAQGNTEFTSRLTREGDGITNGPAIAAILTGAWGTLASGQALVNKMGFFEQGNPIQSAGAWQENISNNDLYKTLALRVDEYVKQVTERMPEGSQRLAQYNGVFNLIGDFVNAEGAVKGSGRKAVKTPLTGMAFGASVKKSIQNMGHDVVDSFFDQIEGVLNSGGTNQQKLNEIEALRQSINPLLREQVPVLDLESARKLEFTKSRRDEVVKAFSETVGEGVRTALEEQYGPSDDPTTFLGFRDNLNKASKDSFDLFLLTRDYEIRQFLEAERKAGNLPSNKKGEVLQDLTGNQLKELDKRIRAINPVVHTAMSKASNEQSAGLHMSKQKNKSRYGEAAYASNVTFTRKMGVEGTTSAINRDGNGLNSLKSYGQALQYEDPGVRTFITNVHSTDSAIASRTYKDFPALNVHDAEIVASHMMQEVATHMNKTTFNTLLEHSLPEELMSTALRTVAEFTRREADMESDPEFVKQREKQLNRGDEIGGMRGLRSRMAKTLRLADAAEARKLELFETLETINQYGVEGGEYRLKETDYEKVRERQKTSVTDRVMAHLARRQLKDSLGVEESLREWVIKSENTPSNDRETTDSINRVHTRFLKHGDLERALYDVFPDRGRNKEKNETQRQRLRTQLNQRMVMSTSPSRSIKQTTMPEVMRVSHRAMQDRDTPQVIYDAIKALQKFMADPKNALDGSLTQMVAAANDNDTVLATEVVDYLDRSFVQRRSSPWGTIGKPVAPSNNRLVAALQKNPIMPVTELLDMLDQNILVKALKRAVKPGLNVHYVTAKSPDSLAPATDITEARGFWDRSVNGEAVYIKSPEFVESNVNDELVTHEVLHSVLYDVVEQGSNHKGRPGAFVKEFDELRARTIKHLEDSGLLEEFGNAVKNNHELLAWGLTNEKFQTEVLAKVQMQSKNQKLVTGIKKFFDAISRMLFGNTNRKGTGLEVLAINTAGLMTEAGKAQQSKNTATLKQEFGPSKEDMQAWTTQEVFDSIPVTNQLDGQTNTRLRGILTTIVEKVHGSQGAWKNREGLNSPDEAFIEAMATGKMPFASAAVTAFPLNNKQSYVLEQVELSLREALVSDRSAYKDLVRTFKDAKARIKPSDLDANDPVAAQEKYDMLFDLKAVDGSTRTDHLSRFVALALVEPTVFDAMNGPVEAETTDSNKLGDRLRDWYGRTAQQLSNHLNKTSTNQPANERIQALSESLADVEAKHRADVAKSQIGLVDQAEAAGRALGNKAKEKVVAVAESEAIDKNKSGYVQGLGALVSTVADDRVAELLDAMEDYRAWEFKQRQGLVASMFTELRGATESTAVFHKLMRKASGNERQRKQIEQNVTKGVKERFKSLSKKESAAYTRTILRNDVGVLLEQGFLAEDIERLLSDPAELQSQVKAMEDKVDALGHDQDHYKAYSKLLAYFMATGKARGANMSMNAFNIARMAGTDKTLSKEQIEAAETVIDPLVTMYALQYTNSNDLRSVSEVFKRENPRGTESGALYALKLHQKMKEQSLDKLFGGDKSLMMKGYTREIYNPHKEVRAATTQEGKELVAAGWVRQEKALENDRTDQGETKHLYVLPHGGLQAQVTGSMSYTGMQRKGTAIHGGEWQVSEQDAHRANQEENQRIASMNIRRVVETAKYGNRVLPEKETENFLVPVFNQDGKPVNYRYMMSESNKDTLLDRNNQTEDILGSMASHAFDKTSSQDQNQAVIQSMKDQYNEEFHKRPDAFIKISPDSSDKQSRETYHMLPENTKQTIQDVWGGPAVWVRADVADMVFGYRKFSLSNMFEKDGLERNTAEEIIVRMLESDKVLGKKAGLRIRQGEDIWQELVKEIKDAWVIKNLTTMVSNISSNVTILLWNGMSPKKIVETHQTAIEGLLDYQTDTDELMELERDKSLGLVNNTKVADQRILELKDAIDRNPTKSLIDEGMFQSILDDIDTETDNYSFKSRLVDKVDGVTENVPDAAKKGARFVYMAHDTKLYKMLFKTTQMSDFVARYSLYQHLTTKNSEPLDHETAVQQITDSFVNYDIPSHRTLQYMNDMGLVYFTKYYIRIQKVLMRLFQDKPARAMALMAMGSYLNDVPTVLDSGPRVANPLNAGALNYPGSMKEILPIKMMLSVF